jgi:hypothetical protein
MLFYTTDVADYGYDLPDLGPRVSKVNLHTAIWTLLDLYAEETECKESREIFREAAVKIQEIERKNLYDILIDNLPEFRIDELSVLCYAEKIICFKEEETYAR